MRPAKSWVESKNPNRPLELVHQAIEALNLGDRARLKAVATPRTIHKDLVMNQVLRGDEAITEWLWSWRTSFPDLFVRITGELVTGEQGVVELLWCGTHNGPFQTLSGFVQATGKPVNVPGYFLFTAKVGKLAKSTHYFDLAALLYQLGLPPGSSSVFPV